MKHLKATLWVTSALLLSAAVGVPLASLNVKSAAQAEIVRTSNETMSQTYETLASDRKFAVIADKIVISDNVQQVSSTEPYRFHLVGPDILRGLYVSMPGTKALLEAEADERRLQAKLTKSNAAGKLKAQEEAGRFCALLDNNDLSEVLSSEENKEFLQSESLSKNYMLYLSYCESTGTKISRASEVTK